MQSDLMNASVWTMLPSSQDDKLLIKARKESDSDSDVILIVSQVISLNR